MSMVSTTHLANQSFREAFVIPCQPAKTRCPTKTALLVAPIFSRDGKVKYYLPQGEWRNLLTDEVVQHVAVDFLAPLPETVNFDGFEPLQVQMAKDVDRPRVLTSAA